MKLYSKKRYTLFFLFLVVLTATFGMSCTTFAATELKSPLWDFSVGTSLITRSSASIGADGTIYSKVSGNLYAINPDGSVKWQISESDISGGGHFDSDCSPVVGSDGKLYVAGFDDSSIGILYVIDPATHVATLLYKDASSNTSFRSSPAISSDGTIYAGNIAGVFYAFNSDGSVKWKYPQSGNVGTIYSSPAIGSDGTIYFGAYGGNLYALNQDGSEKWVFNTSAIYGSPAIGSDGTIFISVTAGRIYAVNPDGSKKWEYSPGRGVEGSPVIGADGTVYCGDMSAVLHALNPDDGSQNWETECFESGETLHIGGSPAVGDDGKIYVAASRPGNSLSDGHIYCLNADGSKEWYAQVKSNYGASPTIGADGNVYFSSTSAYAFASSANGLADSSWPKFHGDIQNSGNINIPSKSSTNISASTAQPDGVSVSVGGECDKDYDATDLASRYHTGSFTPKTDSMAFNATITSGACGIFQFNSTRIPDGRVSDVSVMKLFDTNGTSMSIGNYAETGPEYVDGHWWMTDNSGNHLASSDKVTLGQNYYVYFVVQDNGIYDEDRALGSIMDPVVVGTASSSGSSTGCTMNPNADFSLEWLLLGFAVMLLLFRVKSRN